ncbi:MAG: EamA family transporter [Sphaerochaeta sp.]|jgi:transporter family protein|nr:EamA family transporter [Spirochaetales bacterium]
MWIAFAVGSALFAGATSILAKLGIKESDSTVATAIRTVVVLLFSWLMVLIVGSGPTIKDVSAHTLLFLALSGLATGGSWLCYFRALQIGPVNKVVPIDKSSTALTILLALIFLGEGVTPVKLLAVALILGGTYMMTIKRGAKKDETVEGKGWLVWAIFSAIFASLTAILGKIGISGIDSTLGTAIRTIVVLIMAWIVVLVTGKAPLIKKTRGKELFFICLSGLATGGSWLCYYKALHDGPASVVVPIDKLSILVTIAFGAIVFKERLDKLSALGLVLIVGGTLSMLL